MLSWSTADWMTMFTLSECNPHMFSKGNGEIYRLVCNINNQLVITFNWVCKNIKVKFNTYLGIRYKLMYFLSVAKLWFFE